MDKKMLWVKCNVYIQMYIEWTLKILITQVISNNNIPLPQFTDHK